MKRLLIGLLTLVSWVELGRAQAIGDSAGSVREALGAPPLERRMGERVVWMYPDGTKVVLKGDIVVEVKSGGIKPPAPAAEASVLEPTASVLSVKSPSPAASVDRQTLPKQIPSNRTAATKPGAGVPLLLLVLGSVIMFVCAILIIIQAFKAGMFWGLGCLLIPFVQLLFVMTHWSDTKKPFLVSLLLGFPLVTVSKFV